MGHRGVEPRTSRLSGHNVYAGIRTRSPHLPMTDREMSCAPLPRCPVMSAYNRHLNRHLIPKQGMQTTLRKVVGFARRISVGAEFLEYQCPENAGKTDTVGGAPPSRGESR